MRCTGLPATTVWLRHAPWTRPRTALATGGCCPISRPWRRTCRRWRRPARPAGCGAPPPLPPRAGALPALEAAGQTGGVCDAAALRDRAGTASDDATEAAGWPFFGQIVAHDITADRSPVGPDADVPALRNARSPKLDLELVYGDGPVGHPYLYDLRDPARLLLGRTAGTSRATRRASRSSVTRATTFTCSRTGCTLRCCTPTTAWSPGCVRTASPTTWCSTRRAVR